MRIHLVAVLLAACGAAPPTEPAEIRRVLLAHHDVAGLAGWETRVYLVEYPPGASAPPHTHPATGIGYVLEGRFESRFADEAPTVGEQGHAFVDKAGAVHASFRNPDPDRTLRFVVAYTIRTGEEPMKLVR